MQTPIEQLPPSPAAKTNVLSIVSLVTGILGFLGMCLGIIPLLGWFCYTLGGLLGLAGLITGFLGMSQAKSRLEKGRGMAIAGIVLGALTLLGICVMTIITLTMGPVLGNIFSQITNNLYVPTP